MLFFVYYSITFSSQTATVLVQIQPTSGPREIHVGQIWADTACCLGCDMD